MKNEPKVTVFLSCYNHEKYVAEAMNSILNQTYRNLEVCIVNDGSTDQSADIIETFLPDERVHFINLKENTCAVGAFMRINEFIHTTDSKYIAGASSDDKWELDKIEKQVSFLEKNTSYKACFTWDTMIFEEGADLNSLKQGYSHVENKDRFSWYRFFSLNGNRLNAVSVVMHREVYIELGDYNWIYRNLQDFDLWIKLSLKYPFYIYPEALTYYRKHTTNLSTSSNCYVRTNNEAFYMMWETLRNVSDMDFKRAFYRDFIYADASTHEEIMAEKIALFLKCQFKSHQQVAFCLLMENSQNKQLMRILDEKYKLSMKKIHELTGGTGLIFLAAVNEEQVQYYNSSYEVFMDFLDSGDMKYTSLKAYKYQALMCLMSIVGSTYQNLEAFFKVRDFIWRIQENTFSSVDKHIFFVGEDAVEDFEQLQVTDENDYIVVLPKVCNLFLDGMFIEPKSNFKGKRVYLFDQIEHRIKYLWELGLESSDVAIFFGCLDDNYPIVQLLENISLQTKLYRIPTINYSDNETLCYYMREIE